MIYSLLVLLASLLGGLILKVWYRFKFRLPPGPSRRPIIGNLLDSPPEGCKEWEHWLKHKELYGMLLVCIMFLYTEITLPVLEAP